MLEKIKDFIDKHKYLAAFGVGLVIVAIYYVTHSGSATQQAAASDSGTDAYDLQIAQLNAQLTAQQEQDQTSLSVAGLQATAQQQTIAAQLSATENTNATQVSLATVETGAQTTQEGNYESAYEKIYDALINGQLTENGQNDSLAESQINAQASLENGVLSAAGPPGSGRWGTTLTNLLESVNGQQGALESSSSSQATEALASALQTSTIISGISSGFGSLASSVF